MTDQKRPLIIISDLRYEISCLNSILRGAKLLKIGTLIARSCWRVLWGAKVLKMGTLVAHQPLPMVSISHNHFAKNFALESTEGCKIVKNGNTSRASELPCPLPAGGVFRNLLPTNPLWEVCDLNFKVPLLVKKLLYSQEVDH